MSSYSVANKEGLETITIIDDNEKEYILNEDFTTAWKLVSEFEVTVDTDSTSAEEIENKTIDGIWTKDKFILVTIRDKEGKRDGYFYGSDNYLVNYRAQNEETTEPVCTRFSWKYSDGKFGSNSSGVGVYLGTVDTDDKLYIRAKYSSSYSGTINSTYVVKVYMIDFISGAKPFD